MSGEVGRGQEVKNSPVPRRQIEKNAGLGLGQMARFSQPWGCAVAQSSVRSVSSDPI